jgi:hypothetical protein
MRKAANLARVVNKIHGSLIAARLAYVEMRWGGAARQEIINRLPFQERQLAEKRIFAESWFELSILELIDRAIAETLALCDAAIFHQLGRFSAEYNLRRLPSKLIDAAPEELLQNFHRVNALFQDFGRVEFISLGKDKRLTGAALLLQFDGPVPFSYCASARGYFERLLELKGYRVVSVKETECQLRGHSAHRYEIWWQTLAISEPILPPASAPRNCQNNFKSRSAAARDAFKARRCGSDNFENFQRANPSCQTGILKSLAARGKYLPIILALISLLLIWQTFTYLRARPLNGVHRARIHYYHCAGAMLPAVRFDKPYLLIKTAENWSNVKITAIENDAKLAFNTRQIVANTITEIDVGDFNGRENAIRRVTPTAFSFSAIVNGRVQNCSCQLERK